MRAPQKPPPAASAWSRYRRELGFLILFVLILGTTFTLISWNPVNDRVIEPFTGAIARAGGATLNQLGQQTTMSGTIIRNDRFAVNIRNGCNGVEAMLIYFAAVLAFPASWRSRLLGVVLGFVAIQLVNLVRVVALFLTGVYFPRLFDSSHTVIWQTVVILSGVLLWILWANRFAELHPGDPAAASDAPSA
ncbi:MAG: exosortase H [Thermoanaerobaculia bacterium]|nr:exosortase H [Thermoanaerobaculia bacterium]